MPTRVETQQNIRTFWCGANIGVSESQILEDFVWIESVSKKVHLGSDKMVYTLFSVRAHILTTAKIRAISSTVKTDEQNGRLRENEIRKDG